MGELADGDATSTWNGTDNILVGGLLYLFDPIRLQLIIFWVLLVLISITWCLIAPVFLAPVCIKRKFFHLTGSIIFVSGILVDFQFLNVAAFVALAGFIVLEVVRLRGPKSLADVLNTSLCQFLYFEEKTGIQIVPFILPHIYLLLGLSLPVWLDYLFNMVLHGEDHTLACYAGVITIGVGDSLAAIVGKSFGHRKWNGQDKTVEGSTAMFLSMFVITEFLVRLDPVLLRLCTSLHAQRVNWVLHSLFATVLEAFALSSDNIIVPVLSFFALSVGVRFGNKQSG